jgi:RimJ/RimL family protein N-acetyltransferase
MDKAYSRFFPDSLILETSRVRLRLMQASDRAALSGIAAAPEIWTWFTRELSNSEELQAWMQEAFDERTSGKRMPFVIIDKGTDEICGCTSFGNISFFDKRLEIGWTWLATTAMGTGINHQAKFVLLSFAFDAMQFERVEIKTDSKNERARQALVHIGATEEGVLRSHMQMPHGRRRDSVYYSILKGDWETIKMLYFPDIS